MIVSKNADQDVQALRKQADALDAQLEEALVAAEDAQSEVRALAEERDRLAAALAARDRDIATLRQRLARAETEAAAAVGQAARASQSATRPDEAVLTEELQATVEELQVLTDELERTNADLERRVAERTAELTIANTALSDSEERLRFAQRCAGAGTWDWDVDGNRIAWSPECRDLLGLPDTDGRAPLATWLAVVHPDDRAVTEDVVFATRTLDSDGFRVEFRIRHPALGTRWIACIGRVVDRGARGVPRRVIGMSIDVTTTKELEEALRHAKDQAERANDAKTRFLAAASHDLRQPIQAAALYTEVLRRQTKQDKALEVIDLLRASIEGLHGMLNGLLDLSRLEAGVIEPAIVDFVPDDLMTRLAAEFQAEAEASGIELRCLPGTVPVSTDPHLLERVLRNLVSNAIKHGTAGDGGRVLLSCRHTGDVVEFQVWDNGPGIPPADLDVIFEEFRQLKNAERNAAQGFGLGLAIVARIARLLDLKVSVRSEVGNGSVFTVAVPVSAAADLSPLGRDAPTAEDMAALDGRTALVVEDDDSVRHALALLLREWGLTVLTADSTDTLSGILDDLDDLDAGPDVVIADYRLPGGATGRMAVEMVRRRWAVPAIIVTGDTAPERLREVGSLGCRLLHKPIEPMDLAAVLVGVMRA